jgi:hypothetical protein
MPSKPKKWVPAGETENLKTFRFEHEEEPGIWSELLFDKVAGHFTRTNCTFNTPGKLGYLASAAVAIL